MPGMLPSLQDRIKKVAGNKVPPTGMPPTQKPGSPTMPQGNGQPPAQPKAPNANLGKPTQPKAASAAATPGVNTKMNSAPVKNGRPAMAKSEEMIKGILDKKPDMSVPKHLDFGFGNKNISESANKHSEFAFKPHPNANKMQSADHAEAADIHKEAASSHEHAAKVIIDPKLKSHHSTMRQKHLEAANSHWQHVNPHDSATKKFFGKSLTIGDTAQPSNREVPILPQPKVETPILPIPVSKPMGIVEYLQVCVNKKMRKSEELVKAVPSFLTPAYKPPTAPTTPKPPKVPKPKKPRQISSQKDVLAAIKSNPIHPSQEHTPKESPKVLAGRAKASQEVTPKEPQRVTQARQKESAKEVTKPSGAPKEESLPDIGVKKPYHPPAHLHLLNFLTNLANPGSPIIGKVVGAAKNATRPMGKSELFKSDENFAEKYHQKAKVVSIGKTKSGKPVMGSFDAPEHQHFSRDEHKDAQKHHLKQADIHRMSAFKTLSHEEALKHGSAAEHHEAAAHLHHVTASTILKSEEKTPSVGPPAPLPQEPKGRTKIVIPKAQAEMNQARREFNAKHADPKAKVQNEEDFHATKAQLAHRNKQSHDPGVKALGESQWKEVPTKHKVKHHIRNIIGKVRAKARG